MAPANPSANAQHPAFAALKLPQSCTPLANELVALSREEFDFDEASMISYIEFMANLARRQARRKERYETRLRTLLRNSVDYVRYVVDMGRFFQSYFQAADLPGRPGRPGARRKIRRDGEEEDES